MAEQITLVSHTLTKCYGLADSTTQSKVTAVGKTSKSAIKRTGPATHLSVKPGKVDTQRAKALSRKVVIPTAKAGDKGAVKKL